MVIKKFSSQIIDMEVINDGKWIYMMAIDNGETFYFTIANILFQYDGGAFLFYLTYRKIKVISGI